MKHINENNYLISWLKEKIKKTIRQKKIKLKQIEKREKELLRKMGTRKIFNKTEKKKHNRLAKEWCKITTEILELENNLRQL